MSFQTPKSLVQLQNTNEAIWNKILDFCPSIDSLRNYNLYESHKSYGLVLWSLYELFEVVFAW